MTEPHTMPRTTKKTTAPVENHSIPTVPAAEQPYKVPENWRWVRLNNIVNISTGKKDANYGCDNGIYPFFTCAAEAIRCNDYSFDGEALLLPGNGANVGQVYYYSGKFEAYQRTYVLQKLSKYICIRYLYYHILCFWKNYNRDKQYGSATNYIKLGNFINYLVPLPPLAEQQRIVDRVESLFAKLDEAREKAQAVVDGFENRKAAILHQAFTGELTRKWREDRGIGMEGWNVNILKDCCDIGSGGTPSRKTPEYYNGKIPWVKTGEICWNEIYDTEEHISESALNNSSAKLYKAGVVLVAMYGMGITRGRAAILRNQAATNQAVCVLSTHNNLLNNYLYYYFMCNYWLIREQAVGGNQLNLSGTIISGFKIHLPPLQEQTEIVRVLDALLDKEQRARDLAESVIAQIDGMKKAILARAFRGELGTNVPGEAACEG